MTDQKLPDIVSQIIGRWDEFQFLRAFHELDTLAGFTTDLWCSNGILSSPIIRLLPNKARNLLERCGSRHLPPDSAHIDAGAFACMLALRSGFFRKHQQFLWRIQGEFIGKGTQALVRKTGAGAVFSYSYYAEWTFKGLPHSILRLLHQVHPYAPVLRGIYEEEIRNGKLLSEQLTDEIEMTKDHLFFNALKDGPMMAQHIVAASTFTKNTLIAGGLPEENITVIPYGANLSRFKPDGKQHHGGKAVVLFAGRVCARKGIGYLLEAWKMLRPRSAELVILGSIPESREVQQAVKAANATVLGRVNDSELLEMFQRADFLCLPSIAEGFGLVLLESLACGTPIIGTDATGAVDITREFPEVGQVVESRSLDALARTLDDVLTHIDVWRSRRSACLHAAAAYSWEIFRERVKEWYMRINNEGK